SGGKARRHLAAAHGGASGMTQVALIRHAASVWNEQALIQGTSDPPLSPAGAAAAARWRVPAVLAGFQWVASPLARARETARILVGREVAVEPALAEMAWGAWEGRRLADLRCQLGAAMEENEARGLDFRPPGGESPREVQRRLMPWLARVAAGGSTTAAVTHKGVIRAMLGLATGWDFLAKPPVKLAAASAQLFDLDAGGAVQLVRANIPLVAP
ncbi:MAG: histidine phosphatase family protein, partial [Alphaproteobacteria bacterium]